MISANLARSGEALGCPWIGETSGLGSVTWVLASDLLPSRDADCCEEEVEDDLDNVIFISISAIKYPAVLPLF